MPKSAEKCKEIREQTKEMILQKSILYFAWNGFAGTKISDLAKYIGIGQGTIYSYFDSKEELFREIHKTINREKDIKQVKLLASLPMSAKQKINILSNTILQQLEEEDNFAGVIVLNTQILFEQDVDCSSNNTTYQTELYKYTAKIIEQGQKEGSVVEGAPLKLADYYWGVVYLYALKKLFTTKYEIINSDDLERTVLKGEAKK